MKTWIIAGILIGLLVMAGAFVLAIGGNSNEKSETNELKCTACGNSCSANANCGLASCGATQGKTCSCGK